jgi:outer membrane protein assembly factor BamB
MNMKRLNLILAVVIMGFLLAACTGAGATNSWSNALIAKETIYYSGSSMVYALRADNGNVAWQYPEKVSATRLFFAEPLLAGDQVIVGDYAHLLTSLDVVDGSENWQFNKAKGRYIDSPLLVNDLIIAPNADYSVYALDLNGNQKWKFTAEHAFWARPVSDGKTVYIPSMDHYLYALNLTDGSLKWKVDLGASLVARPTLDESGTIYLGNLDNGFFAIDAADGSILWQQKIGGGVWAAPVLHDGKLYFGDQSGNINILDAKNGTLGQFVQTDGAILGTGALLNNGIAFGNEKGELILIGFKGEKIWTRSIDGKLYANLQVDGDRLIVISMLGEKPLVALDANGNENWYFSIKK